MLVEAQLRRLAGALTTQLSLFSPRPCPPAHPLTPAAVRVLKLLLERLGTDLSRPQAVAAVAGPALVVVGEAAAQPGLREHSPSGLAAAVLLASRRAAGVTPFWPGVLTGLTGGCDAEGSDLSATAARVSSLLGQA